MDSYRIALFLHLVALVVAAGATAVTKLAAARRERARTIADALEWHGVLMSAARLFPICLAAFVLTGAYMLSRAQTQAWTSGFVVAGVLGVMLLFASGAFLGLKGKGLKQLLDKMAAANGADHPAPALVPPTIVAVLPVINTGIAVAVVFDMVLKPLSVSAAIGIVGVGIVLGTAVGLRGHRVPAAEHGLNPAAPGLSE